MTQAPPPPVYPNQPGFQPLHPAQGPRNNGWAIASLICGILGCIPVITSLLAVIFGIVGIGKAKEPNTGGKGLAIAGLVLGIIGILGWVTFGGGALYFYNASAAPRGVAKQFAQDVAAGKVDSAMKLCSSGVGRDQVEQASKSLQPLGSLQDTTLVGVSSHRAGGVTRWEVGGAARFTKGTKSYRAALAKEGDEYKIVEFEFE